MKNFLIEKMIKQYNNKFNNKSFAEENILRSMLYNMSIFKLIRIYIGNIW